MDKRDSLDPTAHELDSLRARVAALEGAARENALLRTLVAQAPALIAYLRGPDHVVELANPAFVRLFGGRDILARPVRDALPELVEQGLVARLDRVYAAGEPFRADEYPVRYLHGDTPRDGFFSFVYQPTRDPSDPSDLSDPSGTAEGILVHAVEVTEQVEARRRAQELAAVADAERARLAQVLDVLPEAVLIVDRDGRFVASNGAAAEIMGLDPTGDRMPVGETDAFEAYGARRLDGSPYPSRELPAERSYLHGETVRGEQLLLRNARDGRDVPVLANSAPLRDAAGAIAGAVVVFQDITPLRELERTRDELLSSVSHDLKGPLTTIRGMAQWLRRRAARDDTPEGARATEQLDTIVAATTTMAALIDDLLDVGRLGMEAAVELDRRPTDLVAFVRDIVAQQRRTSRRRIVVDAPEPALEAVVDPARLERVVSNLVSNAVKYSPDGAITVRVAREDGDRAGGGDGAGPRPPRGQAVIAVTDEGVGIPAADLPRVFERFHRGRNVVGRVAGTGIGLASVKGIVERHGGTVAVASEEGKGSTFTVRLPVGDAPLLPFGQDTTPSPSP